MKKLGPYLTIFLMILVLAIGFQNCSKLSAEVKSEASKTEQPVVVATVSQYKSETTGGGSMNFEINDSGSSYTIQLNEYQGVSYSANQKTFVVGKSVPSNMGLRIEGELDILDLMTGACKFNVTPPPACPGCLTGSWTHRYVTKAGTSTPIEIYGLEGCTQNVDENKIRALILEKFNL